MKIREEAMFAVCRQRLGSQVQRDALKKGEDEDFLISASQIIRIPASKLQG